MFNSVLIPSKEHWFRLSTSTMFLSVEVKYFRYLWRLRDLIFTDRNTVEVRFFYV